MCKTKQKTKKQKQKNKKINLQVVYRCHIATENWSFMAYLPSVLNGYSIIAIVDLKAGDRAIP